MVAKQRRSIPKEQRTFSQPKGCRRNGRQRGWSPQPSLQQRNQPRLKMEDSMGVIDYKNAALAELEKVAVTDKENRNAAVWREAITKFSFASHEGNYRLLLDGWCNGELSMVKIDWLVNNKPDGLNLDWTDEKPKLIEAILAARQYSNPEQERTRLTLLTRVQLIDRLAEMVTKEELSKFTAAELKAGLAE